MDILSQIEYNMKTLIENITAGVDSYNFTWGSVNELDAAKSTFPSAQIYIESEDSLDDPNGPSNEMYFQQVNFRIEVLANLETEHSNPRFDVNQELNKALEDLKRLFGNNWSIDGAADTIMYVGSTREYRAINDIMLPSKLITRWRVKYEQDRRNPDTVA